MSDTRDYLGIVVPETVLRRAGRVGDIRRRMVDENLLDMVTTLPPQICYDRDAACAILIFNSARISDRILLIDASRDFPAEENETVLIQQVVARISATYLRAGLCTRARRGAALEASSPVCYANEFDVPAVGVVVDHYAYVASLEEVKENNYNLCASCYLNPA